MNQKISPHFSLFLLSLLCIVSSSSQKSLIPKEASALLKFKSKADLRNKLKFFPKTALAFCKYWKGVQCAKEKPVRIVLEGMGLSGIFDPDSLTRLDQLRVLSLQNNSLTGPVPDLSGLFNLKSLFLNHNYFSGPIPVSISTLHRIRVIDLSFNKLTGSIQVLDKVERVYYLRLEGNRFTGSIPALNQSSLEVFNVSGNNLTGAIPVTVVMLRFNASSFLSNPGLCGKIINKECSNEPRFFTPAAVAKPPSSALGQNIQAQQGIELTKPSHHKRKRIAMILGFSSGVLILSSLILCLAITVKRQKRDKTKSESPRALITSGSVADVARIEEDNQLLDEKVKKVQGLQIVKSGNLVFCAGEPQVYTLDQLMRASAELLGKGTIGTTYKAVLDNRLIVSVKRMDVIRSAGTSKEDFEGHMQSVGGLRHPNLVPLRAFFQAKEERLIVYDYQANGSLFSLIHGSKSTRAKPLHWTSCLKIAEDVAQGVSYIHQAWRLVHGNLKSTNVLLGSDFEACLTDYCLSALASSSTDSAVDNIHKAPEARNSNHQSTSKSDVYSYGVLLLELLTGKPPSQHLQLVPNDMMNWVKSLRGDNGEEEYRLSMLVEVAMSCTASSAEQRPTMWQVLKMIQEVKEAVVMESSELLTLEGTSLS